MKKIFTVLIVVFVFLALYGLLRIGVGMYIHNAGGEINTIFLKHYLLFNPESSGAAWLIFCIVMVEFALILEYSRFHYCRR